MNADPAANPKPAGQSLRWTERVRGAHVLIRVLERVDAARERAFLESLSPQTLRLRFGEVHHPSESLIEHLADLDEEHDIALAAVVQNDGDERILGVARYRSSEDGSRCECAVTVLDEGHGRGRVAALLRSRIETGKANGVREMYSIDSIENSEMAELAHFLGFSRELDPEDATRVVHRLLLADE